MSETCHQFKITLVSKKVMKYQADKKTMLCMFLELLKTAW